MSFFFDLPALLVIGALLFYVGKRLELERLTKITIGLLIVFCFISFSLLLYADIFRMPEFGLYINNTRINIISSNMTGPEFMFGWPIQTGLSKNNVHWLFVIVLFILYPVAIFVGYAKALLNSKGSRKVLTGDKSYGDVRSHENKKLREKIDEVQYSIYSIARYPDPKNGINNLEETVKKAIDDLGGMEHFVHDKDKVLIKVNICGGVPDNPATYTSQEVVGQVVHMVRKAGGVPKVCDADMIWAKFWETAKAGGWTKWAKQENVDLINLSDTELVSFNFDDDIEPEEIVVSKEILDADVIISIPKMKTHLLTGVTLGMKNMYGTLPEIDKAKYHQMGINEVIYRINHAFPPTLTIIDGITGGEAIGPLSADPVPYNTIVASKYVVIADVVASKLIGYNNPFKEIKHLKITKEKEQSSTAERILLPTKIPPELDKSLVELIDTKKVPPNPKDGKWAHPSPEAPDMYEELVENLLEFPLMAILFNIGADFILFDLARLPFLKHINKAVLNILYDDIPRFWTLKTKTREDKSREHINLAIFSLLAILSILSFLKSPTGWGIENSYLKLLIDNLNNLNNSSIWFILGFIFSLIIGLLFVRRMKTVHLVAVSLTSLFVAYLVESYNQIAKWVIYNEGQTQPLTGKVPLFNIPYNIPTPPWFALFSIPIFIIGIIGFTYFLRRFFNYVNLNDEKELRFIPWLAVVLIFFTTLRLEDKLSQDAFSIFVIYIVFAVMGLYFNSKQTLDWNLALAFVAVVLGGLMELAGTLPGLWRYPHYLPGKMPIFISFAWVLNVWAVCCLAMVASRIIEIPEINLCEPFVESEDRDYWLKRTSEESMSILRDCESILKTISENLALEFDRNYIGITEKGIANNFIRFIPKKAFVNVRVRLEQSDLLDRWSDKLDQKGLNSQERDMWLNIQLTRTDLDQHKDLIKELFGESYKAPELPIKT